MGTQVAVPAVGKHIENPVRLFAALDIPAGTLSVVS